MADLDNNTKYGNHIHIKYIEKMADHKNENNANVSQRTINIGIIGVGNVGRAVAKEVLKIPEANLNLVSRNIGYLRLTVEDIAHANSEEETIKNLRRIKIYETINGGVTQNALGEKLYVEKRLLESDLVIFSARENVPFTSFENRDDEYIVNEKMLKETGPRLKGLTGILSVVTDPPELTCERLHRESGIPRNKIIGITYTDTLRFRKELAKQITLSPERDKIKERIDFEEVLKDAVVIGAHDETMVPIYSLMNIGKTKFIDTPINTKYLREKTKIVLRELPGRLQHGETSGKNIDIPALAVKKTIEALLVGEKAPIMSYDSQRNCFVTNISYVSKENLVEINFDFYNSISRHEKRDFRESIENIYKRLKKVKLN